MELFSRKIIAYEISIRNNSALTVNTFKKAFESRNCPQGSTFHSDQGANYTSEQYVSLLKTLKVDQSFSKRGTPYDNAVIESFFSNMKRDDLHSRHFEFFDDLVDAIKIILSTIIHIDRMRHLDIKHPIKSKMSILHKQQKSIMINPRNKK